MTIDHTPDTRGTEATAVGWSAADDRPTREDLRALEEHLEQRAIRRDGWTLFMFLSSAIALIASIVAVGFGSRAIDESERNVRAVAAAGPVAPAQAPAGPARVTLSDFHVGVGQTFAPGRLDLRIANTGAVQHELLVFHTDIAPASFPIASDGNVDEEASGMNKISDGDNLDPGASQSRSVDLSQPGTYVFMCNLPGHFKAGMYSVVTVK